MKTVILATIAYAVFAAAPSCLLSLAALYTQTPRRPDAADDFLVVLYLMAFSTTLSVAGFLIPTAWTASWRRLATLRAVVIAGGLGLISPVVSLLVAAISAPILAPLLRSGHWLGTALFYGLGGLVLGGVALLIVKGWPGAVTQSA